MVIQIDDWTHENVVEDDNFINDNEIKDNCNKNDIDESGYVSWTFDEWEFEL